MGTVVVGLGFREATEGSLATSSQVHWMFESSPLDVGLPCFFRIIEVPHVVLNRRFWDVFSAGALAPLGPNGMPQFDTIL